MVLCYVVSFILVIVGALFFTGKAASYIKEYQNMPEEEKKTINIKPLCRNLSIVFYLAAAIFAVAAVSESFRSGYFKWAMVGWIVLCCADVVFITKSKRYVNEPAPVKKNYTGKKGRRQKPELR